MSLLPYKIRIDPQPADIWETKYAAYPLEDIQDSIETLEEYREDMSPAMLKVFEIAKQAAGDITSRELTNGERYILSLAIASLEAFREYLRAHQPGINDAS